MTYKFSHIYRVRNTGRYQTANDYYYQLTTSDGDTFLLTDNDLETGKKRAHKNPEDLIPFHKFSSCNSLFYFLGGLLFGGTVALLAVMMFKGYAG